jgi:5'-nucleotidase/UDP-sugar diphosphatase
VDNGALAICSPIAMTTPDLPFRTIHHLCACAALALGALGMAGCATQAPKAGPAPPGTFELTIAHINDHHSQLDAFAATELVLDGVPTQVEFGGFARQTALFRSLAGTPNLLKLHAGDALTGSLYYTFFKGKADARMMNTICFDAFIPGNHEFDDGDATLKAFLDDAGQGQCQTPTLSANIVPAPGTPLAPLHGGKPYLQPPW